MLRPVAPAGQRADSHPRAPWHGWRVGVGATALVLGKAEANIQLPLLCVLWGICGLIGLVAVSNGAEASRRLAEGRLSALGEAVTRNQPEHRMTAMRRMSPTLHAP